MNLKIKKMNCVIMIFICSLTSLTAQVPRLELKYSEPLAVFIYVEQLSLKHPDNYLKKQFSNSVYNRDKYKNLLAQFDTLRINYTYEFAEFPYSSKAPVMTESLLKKNLAPIKT